MMIKEKFLGSWKLKSIVVLNNGHKIYPFGKHVKGLLIYTPNDYMAVQIMIPRKYPVTPRDKESFHLEELAQTLKSTGYLAYYGKYEIDSHHQRVIHHVEGSIAQPIIGGTEVRHYRFDEYSGDLHKFLTLSRGNMELLWFKLQD
jgi:hypothetical protein